MAKVGPGRHGCSDRASPTLSFKAQFHGIHLSLLFQNRCFKLVHASRQTASVPFEGKVESSEQLARLEPSPLS